MVYDSTNVLSPRSDAEVAKLLAARLRDRRLQHGWSQQELAVRSGVALQTYIVFERTGKIALHRLVSVLRAFGLLAEFELLARSPVVAAERSPAAPRARGRTSKWTLRA